MARVADLLFELALEHDGVFTAKDAKLAGVSPHALLQAERRGNVRRLSRGIYHFENYPADSERSQLWEAVLWPGVYRAEGESHDVALSHVTALRLHHPLIEYTPPKIDITITSRRRVRRNVPSWLVPHFANIDKADICENFGGLPVTSLTRTLWDCIESNIDRRMIRDVLRAARDERLTENVDPSALRRIRKAIE